MLPQALMTNFVETCSFFYIFSNSLYIFCPIFTQIEKIRITIARFVNIMDKNVNSIFIFPGKIPTDRLAVISEYRHAGF